MSTAEFRANQAEVRERYDRLAGLLVAVIGVVGTVSIALVTWGLLAA